ncbi:MAG TPA: hypothetical protein VFV43_11180 [Limnobacter sp.]|nr:hypothetical protein [Limnobacter sp.]
MEKTQELSTFRCCEIIEGFDGEDHTQEEIVEAFQTLINTGVVWSLQGWYGRSALQLIEAGLCTRP